ncbi:MAG: hypothetical protein BWX60_00728 [Candidatus Marinimicrobia bacterium ADurb.Bin030]|nr:MAG: hypothetical protein BWX60_00728 [Candidatus Marinimicrobia bacterium ADurb.Bin030]
MTSERSGFVRKPLHQITVTDNSIDFVRPKNLKLISIKAASGNFGGDCHSDTGGKTLTKRTGSRFDAR